jgi:hypothetical protein
MLGIPSGPELRKRMVVHDKSAIRSSRNRK